MDKLIINLQADDMETLKYRFMRYRVREHIGERIIEWNPDVYQGRSGDDPE